ncbi:DUF6789 family protein [Halomonas alkalisoli]|uniref:DUF6789 family protein n=1 Tax=Halomonas alkalisoli TaxID=2907158 RepID=UPI001F38A0B3|nr:DUF6789 family protein [Halomonas alkalisoli]MCE9681869.1 hypothetical protein [Halomonas alkalisoli]
MRPEFEGACIRLVAWAIHFSVGTLIWGLHFGLLIPYLPGGSDARRCLLFGLVA